MCYLHLVSSHENIIEILKNSPWRNSIPFGISRFYWVLNTNLPQLSSESLARAVRTGTVRSKQMTYLSHSHLKFLSYYYAHKHIIMFNGATVWIARHYTYTRSYLFLSNLIILNTNNIGGIEIRWEFQLYSVIYVLCRNAFKHLHGNELQGAYIIHIFDLFSNKLLNTL